jgi:uncharacterized protein (TIGR02145 family)
MKQIIFIFSILLAVVTYATAQTTTLTFIGRNQNNEYVQLDRVVIKNLTKDWQETMYWPDTVLTMTYTGIKNPTGANDNLPLQIMQNNPNPFDGTTYAALILTKDGDVSVEITDVTGRIVGAKNFSPLQQGTHELRISLSTAGMYFLTARQNGLTTSIKMINRGNGGTDNIAITNNAGTQFNASELPKHKDGLKGTTDNPFDMGDQMEYIGYTTINGEEVESEHLNQQQNNLDPIVLHFSLMLMSLPTVITDSVTNITETSAICGGNVIDNGNTPITARGVCWGESQNPTINDNHTEDSTGSGIYTSQITGLMLNTTYYVRAYATNEVGTAYGNEVSFTSAAFNCGTSTITDIDDNVYQTVQIGNQCWMKENLRTTRYADGTSISLGSSTSTSTPYRYYPNCDSNNVSIYGYLYNWYAIMYNSPSSTNNPSGVQGICPNGWHVPSNAEWTQLTDYVSSQTQFLCSLPTNISKALASNTGWSNSSQTCAVGNNQSSNNATGFTAFPAGYYCSTGCQSFGRYASFWTSTENGSEISFPISGVYNPYMNYNNGYVWNNTPDVKYSGNSVRCVKD